MGKIDICVGVNWGSESKGIMAVDLAKKFNKYDIAATTNSCQSGHTSYHEVNGELVKVVNRQLPSSFPYVNKIVIGPGAMIKPHVLKEEIEGLEKLGFKDIRERLFIDKHTGVTPDDAHEKEKELVDRIASTGEGVGFSWTERIMRSAKVAKDIKEFKDFATICDTADIVNSGGDVLLEGSQGFGLSLFYGSYPHVTSRDTTPATLLAGIGGSIHSVRKIYGVARTYPIRVGNTKNTSGDMGIELTWEEIAKRSGYEELGEYTTVTKRLRRIAEWNSDLVINACKICGIDELCITFINYLNHEDEQVDDFRNLSEKSIGWILKRQFELMDAGVDTKIKFASTNRYGMFTVH